VATQKGASFEHIVIDGGSTDGSAQILRDGSDRLAYWISEPDSGIGDAMNKGLPKATGQWLLFLHADDELLGDDALSRVAAALRTTNARIAGFPILYGSSAEKRLLQPGGPGFLLHFKTTFYHQATFIRRDVFRDVGPYDTTLRIAMDYEFFLRAWLRGVPMTTFSEPIPSWMRDTGISSLPDWPSLKKRFAEERAIHRMHARSIAARVGYAIYWGLYLSYRRLRCFLQ
jgi:glycosyltransferase involved in cell wall biosynthesis